MPITKYAESMEEVYELIQEHEVQYTVAFSMYYSEKSMKFTDDQFDIYDIMAKKQRILWVNNIPSVIAGRTTFRCRFGPAKNIREQFTLEPDSEGTLVTSSKRRRTLIKRGCDVLLSVRRLIQFIEFQPDFRSLSTEKSKRDNALTLLRNALFHRRVNPTHIFELVFPDPNDHVRFHAIGDGAARMQNIDKRLIQKIYELVGKGIYFVPDMRPHLTQYVDLSLFPGPVKPQKDNRRFYPLDADIYNHIRHARDKVLTPSERLQIIQELKERRAGRRSIETQVPSEEEIRQQLITNCQDSLTKISEFENKLNQISSRDTLIEVDQILKACAERLETFQPVEKQVRVQNESEIAVTQLEEIIEEDTIDQQTLAVELEDGHSVFVPLPDVETTETI